MHLIEAMATRDGGQARGGEGLHPAADIGLMAAPAFAQLLDCHDARLRHQDHKGQVVEQDLIGDLPTDGQQVTNADVHLRRCWRAARSSAARHDS